MDVLLLCPPLVNPTKTWRYCPYHTWKFSFTEEDHGYSGSNLSLGYLASSLRGNGYSVKIIDAYLRNYTIAETIKKVLKEKFLVLGITIMSHVNMVDAITIIKQLRVRGLETHITLGGYYPTIKHNEILKKYLYIDSIVRGEGEITLPLMVEKIKKGESLNTILGISFREKNKIIINRDRPLIENLDLLPFPARDDINFEMKKGFVPGICSSRGCFFNCTFCSISSFYKNLCGTNWRARSAKNTVDEIDYLINSWKLKKIKFVDAEFIGGSKIGKRRAREIANEIISRGLDVKFMIDCRADNVDKKLFSHLKKAGLKKVYLGVESGTQRILNLYKKNVTVRQNKKAVFILRKLGITPIAGCIVFDPFANLNEIWKNYLFFRKIKCFDLYRFSRGLIPFEGTPIFDQLKKIGLITYSFPDHTYNFASYPIRVLFKTLNEYSQQTYVVEKKYKKIFLEKFSRAEILENKLMFKIFEKRLNNMHYNFFEKVYRIIKSNNDNIDNKELQAIIKVTIAKIESYFINILNSLENQ